MIPSDSETAITKDVENADFGSLFGNVLGRVVDLATIDFLYDRNLQGGRPAEQTTQGPAVDHISGQRNSSFDDYKMPLLIGGGVLAVILVVLLVKK